MPFDVCKAGIVFWGKWSRKKISQLSVISNIVGLITRKYEGISWEAPFTIRDYAMWVTRGERLSEDQLQSLSQIILNLTKEGFFARKGDERGFDSSFFLTKRSISLCRKNVFRE